MAAILYHEGACFTEPTSTLLLEKMSLLTDEEFIRQAYSLRVPVYFPEKGAEKDRNVPDYMSWDSEVVALFGFSGLRMEYRALENFEVKYMLSGQSEMHSRTGKRIVRRGDLGIIPPGAEGYWCECATDEPPFMIPTLLHAKAFGSAFFSIMNGEDILSTFSQMS